MNTLPAQSSPPENDPARQSAEVTAESRPSIVRAVAAVTGALVLSVLVTALVASSSDDRFYGTLMTGSVVVTSPAAGRLEAVDVAPGEIVLSDRELFLITDEELEQRIEAAHVRVSRIESQLQAAQATARMRSEQQMASISSAMFDTELQMADFLRLHFQHKFEVTAWSDYLDPADALVSRKPGIDLKSAILPESHDDAEARIRAIIARATAGNEVESLEAKILLCERRLETLQNRRELIVEANEAALGIAELREQLQVAEANLAEIEYSPAEHMVLAPGFGMTGLIRHRVGDRVKKGEVLVELFDRDDEFVLVEFSSRLAPQIRKGTRLHLLFPGDEKREGVIEQVPPQVTSPAAGEQSESRIAVRVIPVGRAWPASPVGSTILVSFE